MEGGTATACGNAGPVLLSRRSIGADRYYSCYSDLTGKDLDRGATYFHARRILYLLKVKTHGELAEIP